MTSGDPYAAFLESKRHSAAGMRTFAPEGAWESAVTDYVAGDIAREIAVANERYGAFASTHEGIGVLLEEVAELCQAVQQNDAGAIHREAVQVAAVATRIARSLGNPSTRDRSGLVG